MYKNELKRIKIDGEKIDLGGCEWYKNFFLFPPLSHSLVWFFFFLFSLTTLWQILLYRDIGNAHYVSGWIFGRL